MVADTRAATMGAHERARINTMSEKQQWPRHLPIVDEARR